MKRVWAIDDLIAYQQSVKTFVDSLKLEYMIINITSWNNACLHDYEN